MSLYGWLIKILSLLFLKLQLKYSENIFLKRGLKLLNSYFFCILILFISITTRLCKDSNDTSDDDIFDNDSDNDFDNSDSDSDDSFNLFDLFNIFDSDSNNDFDGDFDNDFDDD